MPFRMYSSYSKKQHQSTVMAAIGSCTAATSSFAYASSSNMLLLCFQVVVI